MLLRFVNFCALLSKVCSFLAVLLPVSSSVHRGGSCSALFDKWLVINNWKTRLIVIHFIEFIWSFKDLSCKVMLADNIQLWWRKYVFNEASFLSSHVLGGFVQWVWFRTSVFRTSSPGLFTKLGKLMANAVKIFVYL